MDSLPILYKYYADRMYSGFEVNSNLSVSPYFVVSWE
jgi:hypothetical protein